ncbi:hypothetical protein [Candidatus Magnetobacterium casense]|uniref:PatG C-terminal domain-containing protein n=1 Tax=Candidatus Magnetobacterium casense TaxID=1455061 RepID=A0ABS6S0D9_9BACT|nr:hypothetical protein [Candidatus Magnetobacterium casensis]MBV6342097.1 hypothetical protein [Candidatus Magnetobacterium casensis]
MSSAHQFFGGARSVEAVQQGNGSGTCDPGVCRKNPIYAIGSIDMRFPNPGIEREFDYLATRIDTGILTREDIRYHVLRQHPHLSGEVCWVMQIEGVDTYILIPSDVSVLDDLIECISPQISKGKNCNVIIGSKGPIAPAQACNALTVPVVAVDCMYYFDLPSFIKGIPPRKEAANQEDFDRLATDMISNKIMQMTDNIGEMDEHRALNYLAVRYDGIYRLLYDRSQESILEEISVLPSRLSPVREQLNVIFTFTHKRDGYKEKYYVRVDVSDKYPFLANKVTQYYETRGM